MEELQALGVGIAAGLFGALVIKHHFSLRIHLVNQCQNIASAHHVGQWRRDGKTPYIEHPKAVADRVRRWDEKCVAYLHDVIEDTKCDADTLLRAGIPQNIVDAVVAITKVKGQSYMEYLFTVRVNKLARTVKIADMKANLADDPTEKQIKKYEQGLDILED